jgi:hypothetical protein
MKQGGDGNPDVLGLMYWTTTGLTDSIYKRNEKMWSEPKVAKLPETLVRRPCRSIESRLASNVDPRTAASGGVLKAFMPNFVMIDFADAGKVPDDL